MLGQNIWRFTTSVISQVHCEHSLGKTLPFPVENKWWLLAMMTIFFGSGFVAPFFLIARYQLLKK
ncbi:cytochrome c oxidase subunit 7C, mitochondrial-like [Dipodomys spectabilis]|uniref:cytochrome c oxidase subunit 7C, mitochondrial-like n=1 Tax=Dipodomys spectabilis TaxID=105255 RepID=UPI001C5449D1|nr:cytochrome c oxidase subunit 7C, mitochondrial-like [Dipodomys spectabilis]